MTARWGAALLCAALVLAGCADGGSFGDAPLETDDQKASYGIGLQMGSQLADGAEMLDRAAFMRGLEDALAEVENPALPEEEIARAVQGFITGMQAAAAAEGEAYLAENGARDGVTTTESGLQYEVLATGEGESPVEGESVRLHYTGTLVDGTKFDSSHDRGEPAVFTVGGLIPGFNEALTLMQPGSHFRVVIPSDIAYGPNPRPGGPIGPNATLIFEIELLEILD